VRDKPLDKMRPKPRDKAEADDFTGIPGVPAFAAQSLHNHGILTFEQLRQADLRWLHGPVRAAIERWRIGIRGRNG